MPKNKQPRTKIQSYKFVSMADVVGAMPDFKTRQDAFNHFRDSGFTVDLFTGKSRAARQAMAKAMTYAADQLEYRYVDLRQGAKRREMAAEHELINRVRRLLEDEDDLNS